MHRLLRFATLLFFVSHTSSVNAAEAVNPGDLQEIRALFLRQAAGATAHDVDTIDSVLARAAPGQSDPVSFVARAYTYWGRDAVVEHFRKIFSGTWRFVPNEDEIRITPLGRDTAHIFAPTRITLDVNSAPATLTFLMQEIAVRTADGWRISTIIPIPTQ